MSDVSQRPPEPRGGQDDPPHLDTALHAVVVTLADVDRLLSTLDDEGGDLRVRVRALRRAIIRLRETRQED